MTSKFKIGDRVIIVRISGDESLHAMIRKFVGLVGVVTRIGDLDDYPYLVRLNREDVEQCHGVHLTVPEWYFAGGELAKYNKKGQQLMLFDIF